MKFAVTENSGRRADANGVSRSHVPRCAFKPSTFGLRPARGLAFTLIELLLVVAILAMSSLVAVPYFVKSMRGNRLRAASRTIVMAGRYARSMAVLNQKDMALTLHPGSSEVEVNPMAFVPVYSNKDSAALTVEAPPIAAPLAVPETPSDVEVTNQPINASDTSLTRALDGVKIERVEIGSEQQETGTCTVVYRVNGTCVPYSVQIQDDRGAVMRIDVDALSGAKSEQLAR